MKKYIYLIYLLLFISCSSSSSEIEIENEYPSHPTREIVPYPEKYEHDGYDSTKVVFIPDTSIGLISLNNDHNIEEYLGKNTMSRLVEPSDDSPQLTVLSKNNNQALTVYHHYGSIANHFAEFEVKYNNSNDRGIYTTNDDEFITESNIKLGISMGDLRALKGEPDSISKTTDQINFHYILDDFKNSVFLQRYNLPVYYANYTFEDGYLIGFKFGFEYP